jgi:hypothetical protein
MVRQSGEARLPAATRRPHHICDGVISVGASGEPPRRALAFRVSLDQGSQQILDRRLALGPVGLPERSDGAVVSPSGNNSIDVALI